MFLHLCRKRSSTWGHIWTTAERSKGVDRYSLQDIAKVTDEMTFIMYRNTEEHIKGKVERELPQNRGDETAGK